MGYKSSRKTAEKPVKVLRIGSPLLSTLYVNLVAVGKIVKYWWSFWREQPTLVAEKFCCHLNYRISERKYDFLRSLSRNWRFSLLQVIQNE